jgi:tetratricopeptide (TPR) repeat protein
MKCLNIKKAHYGDNNFNLATTYNNIGSVYKNQGRLEEALDMYMKCLNIQKLHYSDNNFNLGITYKNLSLLLEKMHNLPQSLGMS